MVVIAKWMRMFLLPPFSIETGSDFAHPDLTNWKPEWFCLLNNRSWTSGMYFLGNSMDRSMGKLHIHFSFQGNSRGHLYDNPWGVLPNILIFECLKECSHLAGHINVFVSMSWAALEEIDGGVSSFFTTTWMTLDLDFSFSIALTMKSRCRCCGSQ